MTIAHNYPLVNPNRQRIRFFVMMTLKTNWHLDVEALEWIDALLDDAYKRQLLPHEIAAQARARELVSLWRDQIGIRPD